MLTVISGFMSTSAEKYCVYLLEAAVAITILGMTVIAAVQVNMGYI